MSELDRLDSQWGLSPRTSRGAPKRTFQYSAPPATTYNSPSAPAAPAMIPPRETVRAQPPTPAPQLDPATVNSLR
ncbi:hypothetical protein [Prosthecobacter fusiformis]|uniref:hypothetical protein n=1 Tax=Prosthecobacter fusiformis TaxID=48464 RepID=UPI001060B5EB|nr:hypothetical protein [Prosthecobacter fusiformis]